MRSRRLGIFLALIITIAIPSFCHAFESKVVAAYLKAVDARDAVAKVAVVKDNIGRIPSEIKALLYEAIMPRTSEEDREANFHIAEMIAKTVYDITEDPSLLIEVKQTVFNTRLTEQVESKPQGNVHIIDFPKTPEGAKHVFAPDNISISAGQTVRWVNRDEVAHIFASMAIIGKGGIFTPNIDPGKSWEYTFEEPGDYYYICFIHKGMIGKVTVTAAKDGAAATSKTVPAATPVKSVKKTAAAQNDSLVPVIKKESPAKKRAPKAPEKSEPEEDVFDGF